MTKSDRSILPESRLSHRAAILGVALCVAAGGCAHYPLNDPLARPLDGGYRFDNVVRETEARRLFVILSFSGGGTRAAALSYGVLEKLSRTPLPEGAAGETLLDEVDVITSVSGGSFTAAYYALHGRGTFETFEKRFLRDDVQGDLVWRLFNPYNWVRLASPYFSRIDMAAEHYDEMVFDGATFANLLDGDDRPFVIINACDMTRGARFEFTQDQFDLLSSDLTGFSVSRAVAASSAFPVLLSPVTVLNHARTPGLEPPGWIGAALGDRHVNPGRFRRALDARSYLDPAPDDSGFDKKRPFIHLLDGGLADNIGLRGPAVALSSNDASWSLFNMINNGEVDRVVVIVVDAKTEPTTYWDLEESPPSISQVLSVVASAPMDNFSADTIEIVQDRFASSQLQQEILKSCIQRAREKCDDCDLELPELKEVAWNFIDLSFDDIEDPDERQYFKNLPTRFALSGEQVERLKRVAHALLDRSPAFQKLLEELRAGQ